MRTSQYELILRGIGAESVMSYKAVTDTPVMSPQGCVSHQYRGARLGKPLYQL